VQASMQDCIVLVVIILLLVKINNSGQTHI
jgi:hypothetical protein